MSKEKLKKEHFEILLEEINGNVKLVLEGHQVLNKKIDDVKIELKDDINGTKNDIRSVEFAVRALDQRLSRKIDDVDKKLSDKIDAVDKRLSGKIDDVKMTLTYHRQLPVH